MCVIVISETKKISKEDFEACFMANHHGAGMAWNDGKLVHYVKGLMDVETAWDAYKEAKLPCVLHFRLASAGMIHEELTHPFIITKNSPIELRYSGKHSLLFHNGTIAGWKSHLLVYGIAHGCHPKGHMSDTRTAAMIMSVTGDWILENGLLDGKFVVMTPNKIRCFGEFTEHEGHLFSNMSWRRGFMVVTGKSGNLFYGMDDQDGDKNNSRNNVSLFHVDWPKFSDKKKDESKPDEHDKSLADSKKQKKLEEHIRRKMLKEQAKKMLGPQYDKYDTYRFMDND